jgi:transposase
MGTAVAASDDVKSYITYLESKNKQLEENLAHNIIHFEKRVAALEQNIITFETQVTTLEQRNRILEEKLKLALFRQFGRHAEKFTGEAQLPLFDAEERAAPVREAGHEETTAVAGYRRKKGGRKPLDETIPRVEEVVDIPEEEKHCACGAELTCIGEDVSERLVLIPEQVYVLRYRIKKYACHECEGSGDEEEPAVRTGKAPSNLIPGSIATPELLSYVFTKKYCDYVPYYRQEGGFRRIGVNLSRQNMSNWQQKVCIKLSPLFALLKAHIKTGTVVQMDETTLQVIDEPGRGNKQKSYMWLARGGPPDKKAVWYEYRESRAGKHIVEILSGYSGFLQTDGYEAYDAAMKDLPGITHTGCMAHVRRGFFESMKAGGLSGGAEAALAQIKGL